ncbi:DUF1045 domain-containing protein [Chromobacterium sphagni]|uniref:Phosphonate metabolism protein n=1 Tax=Chromobacterium sphagni TaxID=1903179 RepID=A0ABX3CF15_9NEIS|nr:DUF1045 domain-containing protein [Chromobacterium sphagni]OHX20713.1 hypothetical protein BI344_14435 [Chromobacterium sphagni]
MRYALYYAPRPDSALWRAGSRWLGRDAAAGQPLAPPVLDGVPPFTQADITRDAARYGWHATLKAPFELSPAADEARLIDSVSQLAARFTPFALALRVDWLDDFLALRPSAAPAELEELAAVCTVALDPWADRGRPPKPRQGLDARQQALCRRWGYPYVFEQFRFHLTLTAALARDSGLAASLEAAARRHFAGLEPALVDGIALFVEREQGGPFRYLAHCGFDGEVERYGC